MNISKKELQQMQETVLELCNHLDYVNDDVTGPCLAHLDYVLSDKLGTLTIRK